MRKLFIKNKFLGFYTVIFLLVSLTLMFFDLKYDCFTNFKRTTNNILYPFKLIGCLPNYLTIQLSNSFSTRKSLLKENEKIKNDFAIMAAAAQRTNLLEKENQELKNLVQTLTKLQPSSSDHSINPKTQDKYMAAKIVAMIDGEIKKDSYLVINIGKDSSAYVGQYVIDSFGLIGQIVEVGLFTSRVMPITNIKSSIPVVNSRNGFRAILQGNGDNMLELTNVPITADIEPGDVFVTSEIGVNVPIGYQVGKVITKKNITEDKFLKTLVTPVAKMNVSEYILVVFCD